MLTNQRTTVSRKIGVASWHVCAVVLAGSWLVAGVAAAQVATPRQPAGGPQPALAAGLDLPDRGAGLDSAAVRPVQPMISGNLGDLVSKHLRLAFATAQRRIHTKPDCSALFTRLGADGLQLLAQARFAPATTEGNRDVCVRATAGTRLDSHTITLCPAFATMTVNDAAIVLIHEVLHHAGMSEKPVDPNGLAPQEIDRLVATRCGR